ncbi:MAG TPA: enoyl-CoA hydratase/isomerase family protein [Caulobacteraceae bacterium]|jgi:enoyl-CoA hydratase/carnithine racemase
MSQLQRDLIDLGGAGAAVVDLDDGAEWLGAGAGVVRIGMSRGGVLPTAGLEQCDILLTTAADPPRPWVQGGDAMLAEVLACIERQPVAAAVAAQVLRMTLAVSFEQALTLESLGYSMLLASESFRDWRVGREVRRRDNDDDPRVLIEEGAAGLSIRLNRANARNAFDARMRDELSEALAFALDHPDAPAVELTGLGPSFSAGGDLDEFGGAADVGWAHMIRTLRSPARLVSALGPRLTVRVHGHCIGAGIEVPAAAARLTARPDAVFRLPEVSMGLIPGAGGTATIPRRIGRHRAAYMAISGAAIDTETALAWGLVDAVEAGA